MKGMKLLNEIGACDEARTWAKDCKDLREAWETCQRADWMLWAMGRISVRDDRKMRLFACACVRKTPLADGCTVWDLLTDVRSRDAVEVAERYAIGEATGAELDAAEDAAWDAAWSAAWIAARAAAWTAARSAAWTAAQAARDAAARAARAARDAAEAAAWDAAEAAQSDILRSMWGWDEIETTIKAYAERAKEGI